MRHGINKCFSATNPALAMGYEPNPTLFTQAVNGRVDDTGTVPEALLRAELDGIARPARSTATT
jgi:hypothetical protein